MTASLLSRGSWKIVEKSFRYNRESLFPMMVQPRRGMSASAVADRSRLEPLFQALRALDTAAICDADKGMFSKSNNENTGDYTYKGIKLLHPSMRPINPSIAADNRVMVGVARTVQCAQRNDFLAVLRGLMEAQAGDVLMVDTCGSDRAVAGELFALQARQKGLCGIVVDGPVRDTVHVQELLASQIRMYSTSITPYSGDIQSPGSVSVPISCGGVMVEPNDIIMGDNDGVLAADIDTLERLLPDAVTIFEIEAKVKERLMNGESLASMTNYEEHIAARLQGEPSSLGFNV